MPIHAVFPYLRVRDAAKAIAYYTTAFGAIERFRLTEPSGRIGHCELSFDGTDVMVSDAYPESGIHDPQTIGGTPVALHLHVEDADAWIERAVAAGATVIREAADHFYGERSGTVRDPFGHEWLIGHSIETVTPEEMQRRYTALFAEGE